MGTLGECAFLHVAKEQEGGLSRPHREVYVLGLQNRGARGPASRVADVNEVYLGGVGIGVSSFA